MEGPQEFKCDLCYYTVSKITPSESMLLFLKYYFKPEVTEPIKLHVQAKRYLCRNKSYYDLLSDPSKISLELQGGIMDDEKAQKFTS